jgi:hypothetical protein
VSPDQTSTTSSSSSPAEILLLISQGLIKKNYTSYPLRHTLSLITKSPSSKKVPFSKTVTTPKQMKIEFNLILPWANHLRTLAKFQVILPMLT